MPYVNAVSPTNPTWENTETYNIGLDLSLLNGRLTMTADAYVKTRMMYYFLSPTPVLPVSADSRYRMQEKYVIKVSSLR